MESMGSDAYDVALRRLTAREYSSAEMRAYLERKGFSSEAAVEAVAELVRQRFLDDRRYLEAMVRYQAGRGKGPAYIRAKLKQKGLDVAAGEIKSMLSQFAGKTEVESAREVVERRYPGYQTDRAVAAKAIQALLRRGFSYDVAKLAVWGRS